jgi:hypoxanthine phosphoribosyltransferase
MQFDRNYPNALPIAYAIALAKHFEADLELEILQANVVSHTAADAETRILGQPVYIGKLQRGSRILIVDDVITFGSTLANLRGWIETQGATVVGATTLAAGFGATKLALPKSVYDRLLEQFPIHAQTLAKELGFTAECFTNREARFLCGLKQEIEIERLVVTAHEMNLARQRVNPLERGITLDPP